MSNKRIYKDAFDLLCGEKIGTGLFRDVYECKLRDDLIVKVENITDDGVREFHNVLESNFYNNNCEYKAVSQWLAPCRYLSPDGYILLQDRCRPIMDGDKLPDKLPEFLTDVKKTNYGWLRKKFVCLDYGFVIDNPKLRMRKAVWE